MCRWLTAPLSLALLLAGSLLQVSAQDSLAIHHIDVDQGDATLFVLPNGRTLLVDSGLDSRGEEVGDFLSEQGIDRIDAFLVTHYDRDHYGGIDKALEAGIEVRKWYDRGEKEHLPDSKTDDPDYLDYTAVMESPEKLMPGDTILQDSAVSMVVVASNGHVRGAVGKYDINGLDENGYSVTLLVNYNGFNYLIGGDLTRPVEQRLVSEAAVGDLDAYHVNHHGSETSSSHEFLKAIRPEVAVISHGSHGGFNHPRRTVLDTLGMVEEIDVYQTNRLEDEDLDNNGEFVGGNVPSEFIADLDPEGSEGTVTLTVSADSFRVALPARQISRMYEIER